MRRILSLLVANLLQIMSGVEGRFPPEDQLCCVLVRSACFRFTNTSCNIGCDEWSWGAWVLIIFLIIFGFVIFFIFIWCLQKRPRYVAPWQHEQYIREMMMRRMRRVRHWDEEDYDDYGYNEGEKGKWFDDWEKKMSVYDQKRPARPKNVVVEGLEGERRKKRAPKYEKDEVGDDDSEEHDEDRVKKKVETPSKTEKPKTEVQAVETQTPSSAPNVFTAESFCEIKMTKSDSPELPRNEGIPVNGSITPRAGIPINKVHPIRSILKTSDPTMKKNANGDDKVVYIVVVEPEKSNVPQSTLKNSTYEYRYDSNRVFQTSKHQPHESRRAEPSSKKVGFEPSYAALDYFEQSNTRPPRPPKY